MLCPPWKAVRYLPGLHALSCVSSAWPHTRCILFSSAAHPSLCTHSGLSGCQVARMPGCPIVCTYKPFFLHFTCHNAHLVVFEQRRAARVLLGQQAVLVVGQQLRLHLLEQLGLRGSRYEAEQWSRTGAGRGEARRSAQLRPRFRGAVRRSSTPSHHSASPLAPTRGSR